MSLERKKILIIDEKLITKPLEKIFNLAGMNAFSLSPRMGLEETVNQITYDSLIIEPFIFYSPLTSISKDSFQRIVSRTREQNAKILIFSTMDEKTAKKYGIQRSQYDQYLVKPKDLLNILGTLKSMFS